MFQERHTAGAKEEEKRRMVLLNLSKLLHSEVRGYWDEKVDEKLKRATLRKRWEELDKPHEAKAELNGDAVLKQMRSLLDTGFGIKRSETQWKVHNAMMQAMLPKIFGQEFETHSGRILRSLNIKRLRQEVMVVMARRQGKSYSVGMGCAALLLLCSDVRLAVFATGKRMAAALLDITKRMIEKAWDTGAIPRKGYEIVHANQEVFHLKGPDGTERVLNVMPGTAKRGCVTMKTTRLYDKDSGPCSSVEGKCGQCKGTDAKLLVCGACQATWYCSKECQRKNWVYHRTVCALTEILPLMSKAMTGRVAARVRRKGQGFWRVSFPVARDVATFRDVLKGDKATACLLRTFKRASYIPEADLDLFRVTVNAVGLKAAIKVVEDATSSKSGVDLTGMLKFLKLGEQSIKLLLTRDPNTEVCVLFDIADDGTGSGRDRLLPAVFPI